MKFEYDPNKSKQNQLKHGLDFEEEIDRKFDNDEEVLQYFDLSTLKRPGLERSLIEIDFPQWMLNALEHEAMVLGVDRNAVIKFWIAEKLREITS